MTDSHCHLTDPRILQQLDGVLARCVANGVTRMITIGTEPDDAKAAIDVCRGRENVRCAVGVHPNYCHEVPESRWGELRDLQCDPSVVALGEMGLDYFHQFADRKLQRRCFEFQLSLAQGLGRTVVIHSREAIDDTLAVMAAFRSVRAVFHCFTGTASEAERILAAGHYLGFTGAVTFKKNDALRDIARTCPRDRLLVETDAPYLTPEPHRNVKTNDPSYVVYVADVIAHLWGVDRAEVDRVTTANCTALFDWPAA
jgi:TatD DNase family protein